MNVTLETLLGDIISKMISHNEHVKDIGVEQIDIPFAVAPLHQSFLNSEVKYKDIIDDLENYSDYEIRIEPNYLHSDNFVIHIFLLKRFEYAKDEFKPNYNYQFIFFKEDDYSGYCCCTPDMLDYREDKKCCGHNCDSTKCSFELKKVYNIITDSWNGDQHDYWNFEDKFYQKNKTLLDSKKENEKKRQILELKSRINADLNTLSKLEHPKPPDNYSFEVGV